MKKSDIILEKLFRHLERYPYMNLASLSEKQQKKEMNEIDREFKFIDKIYFLPKKEALTLINKIEELDDFIALLERTEREVHTITNDYEKCRQCNIETGWYYSD